MRDLERQDLSQQRRRAVLEGNVTADREVEAVERCLKRERPAVDRGGEGEDSPLDVMPQIAEPARVGRRRVRHGREGPGWSRSSLRVMCPRSGSAHGVSDRREQLPAAWQRYMAYVARRQAGSLVAPRMARSAAQSGRTGGARRSACRSSRCVRRPSGPGGGACGSSAHGPKGVPTRGRAGPAESCGASLAAWEKRRPIHRFWARNTRTPF